MTNREKALEALKTEACGAASAKCNYAQHPYIWIKAAIDHLASTGHLSTPELVAALEEAYERALDKAADIHGGYMNATKTKAVKAALNIMKKAALTNHRKAGDLA